MADPNRTKKAKKTVKDKIAAGLWGLLNPKEKEEIKKAEADARRGQLPDNVVDVLNSDDWRPIFEQWLRDKGLGANVDFLDDVEIYENNGATPQNLTQIVNQYIRPNAPQEITLDNEGMVTALVNPRRESPASSGS